MSEDEDDYAIGIDLGTTYCSMAVYRDDDVEIIPNEYGKDKTPSYVRIKKNEIVVGRYAKMRAVYKPESTVYGVKRLIGRRFNDPIVQKDMVNWPFKVIDDNNTPKISVDGKSYHPEFISAHILAHLKKCAEEFLNDVVKKAVITVPAYFNYGQRQATKDAGTIAGLEVLKIINEPTAAAIAYCSQNKSLKGEVLVFDLRRETFDVAVLAITEQDINIKAIGGDNHLGGQDFDRTLVNYYLENFKKKHGIDLTVVAPGHDKDRILKVLTRLKVQCEARKKDLSAATKTYITLDAVYGEKELAVEVTREKFESLNEPLFQQCFKIATDVVKEAGLENKDIDEIIMIGRSSRIPKLHNLVKVYFPGKKPNKTIRFDEVVACGAAIQAALMTTARNEHFSVVPDISINDAVPLSIEMGQYLHKFEGSQHAFPDVPAIGIDLGTTYSCTAVYHNDKLEIIPNEVGENTTPSYVQVHDDYIVVGQTAKASMNPKMTVYDVKRLIGRKYNDAIVQKDMKIWPFKIIDENTIPKICVNEILYHPETISGHILHHLKTCAKTFLNSPIKKAVITVPAYFNDSQRQATKDAGNLAGLEVLRIINEPTAAAIAYYHKNMSSNVKKTAMVFDFGGGTFDVVVMTINHRTIKIKAVGGDTHLGGQDIDRNLVDYCLQEFQTKNGVDLTSVAPGHNEEKITKVLRRLKNECEAQKVHLSGSGKKAVITLDAVHGDKDLVVPLTKTKLEELNNDLFQKCFKIANGVVEEAGLTNQDIHEVILVGGSSRIPKIKEMVKEHFPGKPLVMTIKADEAVASGAAILASIMTSRTRTALTDLKIMDVVPLSIGVGMYTKNPRSFVFSKIIPKNTPVPCSMKKTYQVNANDDQFINVYEGESLDPKENHWVGRFLPKNISQNRLGKSVDIFISVSSEGIMKFNASYPT